jgi:hypothetical protein
MKAYVAFLFAAVPALAHAAEKQCVPQCRSGYVCHEGACISACNPPCGPKEYCTANGECARGSAPTTNASGVDPKAARQKLIWVLYGSIGGAYAETHLAEEDLDEGAFEYEFDTEAALFQAAYGFRRYYSRVFGVQARATVLAATGPSSSRASGVLVDGSVRLGPVGVAFPWFFGIGAFLGPMWVQGSTHESEDSDDDVHSRLGIYGGGIAETGFIFGEGDAIEIAARSVFGYSPLSDSYTIQPALVIGFAL